MRPESSASRRSLNTTACVYTTYDPSNSRTPSATTMLAARRISAENVDAQIRLQRLGHGDAAVGLLIMLEEAGDYAWKGEAGAVERADKAGFLARAGSISNVGAARLKIGERAARGDLEPRADSRRPGLEVPCLGAREAGVAG